MLGKHDLAADQREHRRQHLAVFRDVIDHQRPRPVPGGDATDFAQRGMGGLVHQRRLRQPEGETETRSHAFSGTHGELPAGDFSLAFRDRQPQSGAACTPGLAPLLEGLEDAFQQGRRDADACVLHFKPPGLVITLDRSEDDPSALRELHPVAQQIDEHLAKLSFVAMNQNRMAVGLQAQAELLLFAAVLKHGDQLSEQGGEIKVSELDLHAPRIDF